LGFRLELEGLFEASSSRCYTLFLSFFQTMFICLRGWWLRDATLASLGSGLPGTKTQTACVMLFCVVDSHLIWNLQLTPILFGGFVRTRGAVRLGFAAGVSAESCSRIVCIAYRSRERLPPIGCCLFQARSIDRRFFRLALEAFLEAFLTANATALSRGAHNMR